MPVARSMRGGQAIVTHTGEFFSLSHPQESLIDIRDIAHSLSQLCRFTGHTRGFYSVAQHSILVSEKIPGGPGAQLAGLLHDAAEAYTSDLASPLKALLRRRETGHSKGGTSSYELIQNSITATIYRKYQVAEVPKDLNTYDQAAALFEAEGFLDIGFEKLIDYGFPVHLRNLWAPWLPRIFARNQGRMRFEGVEHFFLNRFEYLMRKLGRDHEPITGNETREGT